MSFVVHCFNMSKIIISQTLWTNKKDLLNENFGWLTPQHHLMGWALSALKLSQYYNNLQLYTDDKGIEILIDKLQLPYTYVSNEYNNLKCQPCLWAVPKLLTYSKQVKAFLHVDGDVFICRKFSSLLLSGRLIAQNLERGTDYYRNIFKPLLNELKYIPPILKLNLQSQNMKSFNTGIIGGWDIEFFKNYVAVALKFLEKNNTCNLNMNINMIFEQLLFFSMAQKQKKNVSCLIKKRIDDNGYHLEEIADFSNWNKLGYLHLIGPYKRNPEVCNLLAMYLRQENQEMFLRIINLFKKQHYFFNDLSKIYPQLKPVNKIKFKYNKSEQFIKSLKPHLKIQSNSTVNRFVENSQNLLLNELFKYEKSISRICTKFRKIDFLCLKALDDSSINSIQFITRQKRIRNVMLHRNPYTEIIYTAFDWTSVRFNELGKIDVKCSDKKNIIIGVVPELFFSGYREASLDETCINIFILTEKEISYKKLLEKMHALFQPLKSQSEYEAVGELILLKIKYLIRNKLLFVN